MYTHGALNRIRKETENRPKRPLLFRMMAPWGETLWRLRPYSGPTVYRLTDAGGAGVRRPDRVVCKGNVGTPMFVSPNIPSMLGRWGGDVCSDYHFIGSTIKKWPKNSLVLVDDTICICRPDTTPQWRKYEHGTALVTRVGSMIVLGVERRDTTAFTRLLGSLGWNLGTKLNEHAEDTIVQEFNRNIRADKPVKSRAVVKAMLHFGNGRPYAVSDPNFIWTLNKWWLGIGYSATVVWLGPIPCLRQGQGQTVGIHARGAAVQRLAGEEDPDRL